MKLNKHLLSPCAYRTQIATLIVPLLALASAANLAAQPASATTQLERLRAPALGAPTAIYIQPDLIVTNVVIEPGAMNALVSYCVKNIGIAASKAGQVTIAYGGQWRVPPPAGLGVAPPYAFEVFNATSAIAPGAQECKTMDSTIRLDQKYWNNCVDVTVIADATNTSRESNERNNTSKGSSCDRPRLVFDRPIASQPVFRK